MRATTVVLTRPDGDDPPRRRFSFAAITWRCWPAPLFLTFSAMQSSASNPPSTSPKKHKLRQGIQSFVQPAVILSVCAFEINFASIRLS
jgi:hypothetical protein